MRDDARVVDHLVGDRDDAGRLHDLDVGVVDGGKIAHGMPRADAALPQAQVLGPLEVGAVEVAAGEVPRAIWRALRFACQRRHAAVGRIDHQRRPA